MPDQLNVETLEVMYLFPNSGPSLSALHIEGTQRILLIVIVKMQLQEREGGENETEKRVRVRGKHWLLSKFKDSSTF